MPRMNKKVAAKISVSESTTKSTKAIAKKSNVVKKKTAIKGRAVTTSIAKTRPTTKELKSATKKVMKQFSIAIKNLARR